MPARRIILIFALAVTFLAAAAAAGCGGNEAEPSESVAVYLLRGEKLGVAHRERDGGTSLLEQAFEELLAGPTADEAEVGLGSAIPEGTRLLGVEVDGGVATVDLSGAVDDGGGSASMFLRLAQIVFTGTQTEEADAVRLLVDGQPVQSFSAEGIVLDGPQTRSDYDEQLPAILVETPAPFDVVRSPMSLAGSANTFEATFQYELLDDEGEKLAGTFVTATCGTGCRGTFEVPVEFEGSGPATLRVYELSAADGSVQNLVEFPITRG